MNLYTTPRFRRTVPDDRKEEVVAAMKLAAATYCHLHMHAGVALRRIKPFMECRIGLDLRLVPL